MYAPQNALSHRPIDPQRQAEGAKRFVRSVALDIILTLVTAGLWNIWVQVRQNRAANFMLQEERYDSWRWFLLCLVTCGLYHLYHEYRIGGDIGRCTGKTDQTFALLHLGLAVVGLSIIADAIQQSEINAFFGSNAL